MLPRRHIAASALQLNRVEWPSSLIVAACARGDGLWGAPRASGAPSAYELGSQQTQKVRFDGWKTPFQATVWSADLLRGLAQTWRRKVRSNDARWEEQCGAALPWFRRTGGTPPYICTLCGGRRRRGERVPPVAGAAERRQS
eukprot:gene9717-535_t